MLDFAELRELVENQTFAEFVENTDFKEFYIQNIRPKKGGGRDRISPRAYQSQFEREIESIKERCKVGDYKFSPYNEKLILKGKGKYPRVISIPTVRDRFVLALLNRHLQNRLGIYRRTANSYIRDAKDYISASKGEIRFFKTDLKSFYDSIPHDILLEKLKNSVDDICLKMIVNAIKTSTCQPGYHDNQFNTIGIPQGISIASILSEKFMISFDLELKEIVDKAGGLYLRYVDDILILCPTDIDWKSIIEKIIADEKLGLTLTEEKTKSGVLMKDYLVYVGYSFSSHGVGVKSDNQRLFSDRIAGRCHKFVKQLKETHLRPRFFESELEFMDYSIMDINLLISGFRVGNHNYGWLPYFQQIDDLRILYEFDEIVKKICGKTPIYEKLNSFVKTYYALRHNSGIPYVYDFNAASTIAQKTAVLNKMGRIAKTERCSDSAIEYRFKELLDDLTRETKKDMKETS